jgi:hypothetical protein
VTTVKDMEQLQRASYAVAASPREWRPRRLPPVRDQGETRDVCMEAAQQHQQQPCTADLPLVVPHKHAGTNQVASMV